MPEWKRPNSTDTVIAHISDLHFGAHNQTECWEITARFLRDEVQPALILATGDIVDSPNGPNYDKAKKALDALQKPYYVCAGNHDRHAKGNVARRWARLMGRGDTAALFDQTFSHRIALPDNLMKPGMIGSPWQVGILGVDSSIRADFFARGYLDPKVFPDLETKALNPDLDLVILLVHHHLQPIRQLETDRQESPKDLANLTYLVNSGNFLECLARAHVDIVLHGHEHAAHWARYGSLEGAKRELCVLGAGSATGNHASHGCRPKNISFNVIVISANRSATLRVVDYDGSTWRTREEIPLFDSIGARRLRLLRRAGKLASELNSLVTKYVEFTRERDILVHWMYRNWVLEKSEFEQVVENSTGFPAEGLLQIKPATGQPQNFPFSFIKHPKRDHAWYFKQDIGEEFLNQPVQIDLTFKWLGGGLLTRQELEPVFESHAAGLLRRDGYEFTSIRALGAVGYTQLVLALPEELAPENLEIKVYDEQYTSYPDEAEELKNRLVELGPGRYSLFVPYPRENWWYALAWRPVMTASPSESERLFQQAAHERGNDLLAEFRKGLNSDSLRSSARLSLYVPAIGRAAERTGNLQPEISADASYSPPARMSGKGDESAIGQALWGVLVITPRPNEDDDPEAYGFLPDEKVVMALPVKFGWSSSAPWGVVRLGIISLAAAQEITSVGYLESALAPAVLRMLTKALAPS
jgi:UDP-2,3-diacylglucosamine pyrophosphatase LpxH